MADHFASSKVSTRRTRRHLVAFQNQRNWGRFIPGRNTRKKDNFERWTEIFETNFRKMSVPFDFEPEFQEILVEWNTPSITGRSKLQNRHQNFSCLLDPNEHFWTGSLLSARNSHGITFSPRPIHKFNRNEQKTHKMRDTASKVE